MSVSYSIEDIVSLQEAARKKYKKIAENARAVEKISSAAESDLSLYYLNHLLEKDPSGREVVDYLVSSDAKIQDKNRIIRDALWDIPSASIVLNQNDVRQNEYRRLLNEEEIDGFCSDGIVFLKMRMLPRWRSDMFFTTADRRPTYDTHAGKLIERFTWELTEKNKINRADFFRKTIWFMFVYGSEAEKSKVPDSDNHDTKNVQDAVCQCFNGGDEPFSCQTFLSTFVSDVLPQGTYISLFPSLEIEMRSDEILKKWELYLNGSE